MVRRITIEMVCPKHSGGHDHDEVKRDGDARRKTEVGEQCWVLAAGRAAVVGAPRGGAGRGNLQVGRVTG